MKHRVSVGYYQVANVEVHASSPEEAEAKVQHQINDMGVDVYLQGYDVSLCPIDHGTDILVQHEEVIT